MTILARPGATWQESAQETNPTVARRPISRFVLAGDYEGRSTRSFDGRRERRSSPTPGSGVKCPNLTPQQKTPLRGGGALLGLLQGGEICISIYVDPWEVGEPS